MKKLTLTLILILVATAALAGQWQEGSTIGIPLDNAKFPAQIIVADSGTQWPLQSIPPGVWVTIDLANGPQWGSGPTWQPNVPPDIKGTFWSGLLIISHPGGGVTCNITVNFRAPGSTLTAGNYQAQTLEATSYAGVRSNAAVWVPVVDRKFEFHWTHTPGCPSMINLSLQAYVR